MTRVSAEEPVTAPADGYFYRGRPDWLTDDVLKGLVDEAAALRPGAVLLHRQHHAPCGPVASAFADSADLHALIREHAGPAAPAGRANYLYYDDPGQGIDPHIDHGDFQLNVLLTLDHQAENRSRSHLVLFPHGPEKPLRIDQRPGELVLFWATAVVHARTNVGPGEQVRNIGIGYQPRFALPSSPYWSPV
ncbi:hypothetical protein SUDANB95_04808 [Actinosynnema sp. ALI-1.44]